MSNEYVDFSWQPTFKPVDKLFEDRLRQFTDGGQFSSLNLPKFYNIDTADTGSDYVNLKVYKVPDDENGKTQRPLFKDIDWSSVEWKDAKKGDSFGPSWKTFWFKIDFHIPSEWIDKLSSEGPEAIELHWDSNNEALIYSDSGLPLQAFTGGNERTIFRIPKQYWDGKEHTFYLEMACNSITGNGSGGKPDANRYFNLSKCDLVLPNLTARKLYWDYWILSDAAREFPGDSWQKWQANQLSNDIMNHFDPDNVDSLKTCRDLATKYLGDKRDSSQVFNPDSKGVSPFASKSKYDVLGVGNCHIDTAWLWPWAETRRKIVRSWTTQLRIAEAYPEYVFVASQMQQFKWLKEDHPEILKQIKEKFATNQFFPIGGSWVENDTNLPNGESLIRQFLLGQRFQYKEFGYYSSIYWLPDTFGYSSQIPQICKEVGMDKFLTQKLSWNNINSFPLTTFNWVGIDKSQVVVHMPPANTYTADAHFGDISRSLHQHNNLRDVPTSLMLYGHGDGGGGPTEEMVEKIRRCRGLSDTSGLLPKVHLGNTIEEFYEDILERSNKGQNLPSWTGEMYLEYHRGCYTSQALVKKLNRQNEVALHDLEWIASLVSVAAAKTHSDYHYPREELQSLWEDTCLAQFHDVLPGSSIGMVYYEEAIPTLKRVQSKTKELIKAAVDAAKSIELSSKEVGSKHSFMNTLPWNRLEIVEVSRKHHPELYKALTDDKEIAQIAADKSSQQLIAENVESDSTLRVRVTADKGHTCVAKGSDIAYPASVERDGESFILTNKKLKATVSKDGVLTSVYDLENEREIIDTTATKETSGRTQSGASGFDNDASALKDGEKVTVGGNQVLLFDDEPLNFPAWDTELYSLHKFRILGAKEVLVKTNDALESSVVIKTPVSDKSHLETVISIHGLLLDEDTENNYIHFKTTVEWHETYKFLKVQFPTTIYTATNGNYETQFGITQRPTHYNTSWDVAKFEVCHHKFMDLSEHNYGVSILNSSKYGAAIHGNLMRLSLLRSPKAPDDEADMGRHEIEYALYPHKGPLGPATVRQAYNFNYPMHPVDSGASQSAAGHLSQAVRLTEKLEASLVLSHLKRAEPEVVPDGTLSSAADSDRDGGSVRAGSNDLVVRVYESLGGTARGALEFDESVVRPARVYRTNALEHVPKDALPIWERKASQPTQGSGAAATATVPIRLRGFEIATYRIELAED